MCCVLIQLSVEHHQLNGISKRTVKNKDLNLKTKEEQKEVISKALKERKIQSSKLKKFIGGSSNVTVASYVVSNEIAKHRKPFSDGQFIKQAWLKCAPVLFENSKEKEKIFRE